MLDDVSRIEFIGVALSAENHGGLQGTRMAGGPVGDKVKIGKTLGIAGEIRRGRGLLPLQDFTIPIWKVAANILHLRGCLSKHGKIDAGLLGVADKEKALRFRRGLRRACPKSSFDRISPAAQCQPPSGG